MNTVNTYPIPAPSLAEKFAQAEVLRQWIDAHKGGNPSLWATIVNRLRTDWTYHSNGIEGSTLTRGQTHFFLTEVRLEEKSACLQALAQADQGDLVPFIGFITDTVIATQQSVVDALEKKNK